MGRDDRSDRGDSRRGDPHITAATGARLRVDVRQPPGAPDLARDVVAGLGASPKSLPPKYLYDDRGSALFEAITRTAEYYPTRAEVALLESVAAEVADSTRAAELVELGSGSARKTRTLLDALGASRREVRYVPFDVSEGALRRSAEDLLRAYPLLRVHGVVGDFHRDLGAVPEGGRRLVAFLGSTMGNLSDDEALALLAQVRAVLGPGDHLLLGLDLVKDEGVLLAAYNDSEGITAAFNLNLLAVLNRGLDADFDPARFEHLAFWNPGAKRMEMHLRARLAHRVRFRALDLDVDFAEGETLHTEISRKYLPGEVRDLLQSADLRLVRWWAAPEPAFGLALATAAPAPP
ncbi:L-histidine N(alpha)-methyltransferase [Myxococcota bacterium]|nr:L-histidine N(alpha)-methyltransferase [Myxococcota bacterium]